MEESLLCGVHFHTSSALLERFKHFTQHAWFTLSWKHFVCIHTHSAVHADATYAEKEMNNRLVFTLSWLPQLHESTFLYQHWLSEISNTLRLPQMFCSLIAERQRRKSFSCYFQVSFSLFLIDPKAVRACGGLGFTVRAASLDLESKYQNRVLKTWTCGVTMGLWTSSIYSLCFSVTTSVLVQNVLFVMNTLLY